MKPKIKPLIYTFSELFRNGKERITQTSSLIEFKNLITASTAKKFGIKLSIGKTVINEGEYVTKKETLYALQCFTEK